MYLSFISLCLLKPILTYQEQYTISLPWVTKGRTQKDKVTLDGAAFSLMKMYNDELKVIPLKPVCYIQEFSVDIRNSSNISNDL